jgi:hypothetical protein
MMNADIGPFFARLPYDVRAIVYAYLKHDKLPPFAPGLPVLGFLLSCRQAHQEILEIILPTAQERLAVYLAKFKVKSQIPEWDISTTQGNVCSITVSIPWDDFCTPDGLIKQGAQGTVKSMHPLFALYFDMVRIHVSGKDDGWSPSHDALRDRGRVDENMQRLLRDVVARMIDRQRDVGDVSLESAEDLSEVRPDLHVRTRRICISWDLRSGADSTQGIALNGELHHSRNIGRESYDGLQLMHGVRTEDMQKAQHLDPRCYPRTVFYHLHDPQRLLGHMCLQSYSRWAFREEGFFLNEVLNGQETDREYVSSESLGMYLERGLRGISEEEYEMQEREVEAVLWP